MSYFYLIASLPLLDMEQPPIPEDVFMMRCEAELSNRDFRAVQQLNQVPYPADDVSYAFTRIWRDHEIQIRNTVAKLRASKRHMDASRLLHDHTEYTTQIDDDIEKAWTQPTPLEREKALDHLRWNLLDNLQGPDPFSLNVLLAYTVKRRLAQRWSSMDADAGWETARATIEQNPAGASRQLEPETAGHEAGAQT
jgi:hypothetical protein